MRPELNRQIQVVRPTHAIEGHPLAGVALAEMVQLSPTEPRVRLDLWLGHRELSFVVDSVEGLGQALAELQNEIPADADDPAARLLISEDEDWRVKVRVDIEEEHACLRFEDGSALLFPFGYGDPADSGAIREAIERFCGWVERNLTMNGSLDSFLEAIEDGPARRDRDLKQELLDTRAALDQASRLVEGLRAELLKGYPTAASTSIVARALGSSAGIAAGFAMGVLATMTVAGVTSTGGALIVGVGGNALYDALKATLAAVQSEAAPRAETVVAAVESDRDP